MNIYKLTNDSTFERIKQYYLIGYELRPKEERIRQRWEAAHALVMEAKVDIQAARILSKRFDVTLQQAYVDIGNAKNLFGDVRKSNKDALRYMVTEWAIDLFSKAKDKEDYYAAAKALEKIIKANNLDKEDQDLPDPSKIQPPVQLLSINFNFINTPWFKKIDPKAQEGLLELYNKFMAMIENSPMKDYLNMFQEKTIPLPDPQEDGD